MSSLPYRNIAGYLSRHYGRDVLYVYDELKKSHERRQSLLLDLKFLKSCRAKKVIPKFLWFKTGNEYLSNSAAYRQCQERLLIEEIRWKYKVFKSVQEGLFVLFKSNERNNTGRSFETCAGLHI